MKTAFMFSKVEAAMAFVAECAKVGLVAEAPLWDHAVVVEVADTYAYSKAGKAAMSAARSVEEVA